MTGDSGGHAGDGPAVLLAVAGGEPVRGLQGQRLHGLQLALGSRLQLVVVGMAAARWGGGGEESRCVVRTGAGLACRKQQGVVIAVIELGQGGKEFLWVVLMRVLVLILVSRYWLRSGGGVGGGGGVGTVTWGGGRWGSTIVPRWC